LPGFVDGQFIGQLDGLGLFTGQVQHGGHDAGVGALPLEQGAEDDLQDVADLAQELARRFGRLGGRVLQHHGQVVGQFAFAHEEASSFVGLDQVHHGRAAVAAVAVYVLEEVQRRATATVEQLHELGFGVQRVAAGQALQQRVQLGQAAGRQGALLAQRSAEFAKVRTKLGIRVAQQVREHPQGQGECFIPLP
jgi:hypothetical protein